MTLQLLLFRGPHLLIHEVNHKTQMLPTLMQNAAISVISQLCSCDSVYTAMLNAVSVGKVLAQATWPPLSSILPPTPTSRVIAQSYGHTDHTPAPLRDTRKPPPLGALGGDICSLQGTPKPECGAL